MSTPPEPLTTALRGVVLTDEDEHVIAGLSQHSREVLAGLIERARDAERKAARKALQDQMVAAFVRLLDLADDHDTTAVVAENPESE